ncbi:hypothetical protein PVAP13_5NG445900 [Panicum virgatum]|uniref:F-box domain-containing protein n=1 Tax=Panicum virgatum TaxID=38727 RepID=A0A8T0RXL4_PANVG|nr:hypothetical protein PVAP13_5NG445900 [Panicum virgatum]
MSSGELLVLAAGQERGGDRLSRLSDDTLGHILSFLPSAEAARAAALSRRWRHVFPAVHTISFEEADDPYSEQRVNRRVCSYCSPDDPTLLPAPYFAVGAALVGRDRGARAPAAPLRALRVLYVKFGGGDSTHKAVNLWISYAAYHAGDGLQIDLRLGGGRICPRAYALRLRGGPDAMDHGEHDGHEVVKGEQVGYEDLPDDGEHDKEYEEILPDAVESCSLPAAADDAVWPGPDQNNYVLPRSLFSCAALRSLRLRSCWLDPPAAIALPSLDTLHLTQVTGGRWSAFHRLVSACPRLADLTLEACTNLAALSVLDVRLRRLALRCCHELAAVSVDASELRVFEYRGAVPDPSFLTMHGPCNNMSFCSLDFCGEEPASPPELACLGHFLQLFAGVERLHLKSARLGCGVGHGAFSSALAFPALRHLEMTGTVPDDDDTAVAAVTRILRQTPNLETLSLFFLPEPEKEQQLWNMMSEEEIHAAHKLRYSRYAMLAVPYVGGEISCLMQRTREINLVHYQGAMAQRLLAKFLLCNAPVVDEVCCTFARGPLSLQIELMKEIKGWVMNKSANMLFL